MILRKPFAFFIKHFKFIHLILTMCAIYLVIKTSQILSFYLEYLDIMSVSSGTSASTDLFSDMLWISNIIIILGSILIAILMKFKKKPIRFYNINIINYIVLTFIYIFTYSTIKSLESGLVDIRTLKMVQDFLVIAMIFQIPSTISLGIRALGFDIKKFDFERDLEELKITSEDSEEIEINLEFDFDKFKRNIRKRIRHFKYIYTENKVMIISFIFILLAITGFCIYLKMGVYDKSYNEGQNFNVTNYQIGVNASYSVDTDYKGNKINDKISFIVVSLNLKSNFDKIKLETARIALEINNHLFYSKKDYKTEFSDLGTLYTNQNLTNENTNYIVVFEIPKDYQSEKMKLKYFDYNDKEVTVNLRPNNFLNSKSYNYNLNDVIKFDDSIIGNTTLKITEIEVSSSFKNNYQMCLINDECIDSYEYLVPTCSGNYDKTLIKIKGKIKWDENKKIEDIDDLYDFIRIYGNFSYILNGEEKFVDIPLKQVKPNRVSDDEVYYIEVNKEVEQAEKINLIFTIRDKVYKYVVK